MLEWMLLNVPRDIDFNVQFHVGKKMLLADFNLRKGDNAEQILENFFANENIPKYLKISILSALNELLAEDVRCCDDERFSVFDASNFNKNASAVLERIQEDSLLEFPSRNQHLQWIPKKSKQEVDNSVKFSSAYKFLVESYPTTRDTFRQLEFNYARAILEMTEKSEESISELRTKMSEEMQRASETITDPTKVAIIVAQQVEQLESLERSWRNQIQELKKRQLYEYYEYISNLYTQTIQGSNNTSQSTANTTPTVASNQSSVTSSPGRQLRNLATTPIQFIKKATHTVQGVTPVNLNQVVKSVSNSVSTGVVAAVNATNLITGRKTKETLSKSIDARSGVLLSSQLTDTVMKQLNETFVVMIRDLVYSIKLSDSNIMENCKKESSATDNIVTMVSLRKYHTYSDHISAILLVSDPEFSMKSSNYTALRHLCAQTTEFHFEDAEAQFKEIQNRVRDNGPLKDGDVLVTKHSTLGNVGVVFHLIVDPKQNFLGSMIHASTPAIVGLVNVLKLCNEFNIENLAMPLLLMETGEESMIASDNEAVKERVSAVLQAIRDFLEQTESESIKSIQCLLPSVKNFDALFKSMSNVVHSLFTVV